MTSRDHQRRARAPAALLIAAAASAWGAPAFAQTARDPAAAEALFNTAKELLKAGDWATGCAKLRASMELDPAVGTQLKIAKCHEHDGKLALAWYAYQRALQLNREKLDQTEARRRELDAFTAAQIAALEPRVPKLRVTVASPPPGLKLLRDGAEIPTAALGDALPIDAGDHEIVAEAPGFERERRMATATEGKVTEIAITLRADAAAATPAPPPVIPPPPVAPAAIARAPSSARPARVAPDRGGAAASAGSTQRTAGLVVGGAGIVSLAVAGVFGLQALGKVSDSDAYCGVNGAGPNDCTQDGVTLREEAGTRQTIGFVLLGVGAAAVTGGVVLYVTAPSAAKASGGASGALRLAVGPARIAAATSW